MNKTAFNKKSAHEQDIDGRLSDPVMQRPHRWSDRVTAHKPLSARHDIEEFNGVSRRPANDDLYRSRRRVAVSFVGSRYFWAAMAGTAVFCMIFALMMGFRSSSAFVALLRNPVQYSPFFLSIAVIAAIQWLLAMSAHRQALSHEMWRRMMTVTHRLNDPSPLAEEANRNLNTSFERLFADLDSRMMALDEKTGQLAGQLAAVMHQSSASADVNLTQMRNIVDATEMQREALQRSAVMISTEMLPVVSKLEAAMQGLDSIAQNAGGILGPLGDNLQHSVRELQACLDDFNRANHTVAPEIEKRILKFEASITRLPEQLDATLNRLNPLSETIADAAMLSTANIEVIDQLGKDISTSLNKSRELFGDFAANNEEIFQNAVDVHVTRFRDLLSNVISEETARLSGMTRELSFLAETASATVEKLSSPVNNVSAIAAQALEEMAEQVKSLDERIQESLELSVAQLNEAASELAGAVSRDIEAATEAMQNRISASSEKLVQRVNSDADRFESLVGDVAEKTSSRVAAAIKELPAVLSERMETEISKVDGTLKGSIVGLSDQMRATIDGIPARLDAMTRETLASLEANLDRSFDGVAQRSERLNEQFKKNAAETTEAVLENYVDFIFVAVERFRNEMETLNQNLAKDLEMKLKGSAPRTADAPMAALLKPVPLADRAS